MASFVIPYHTGYRTSNNTVRLDRIELEIFNNNEQILHGNIIYPYWFHINTDSVFETSIFKKKIGNFFEVS